MAEHTSWEFVEGEDNCPEDIEKKKPILGSIMKDGYHVARVWRDCPDATDKAEYIVRTANAFEDLVEALERFLEYGDIYRYRQWEISPYKQAQAAILKAKGAAQ